MEAGRHQGGGTVIGELGDIGAGGEEPRTAPKDHGTGRILGQQGHHRPDLRQHPGREGIHLGPVEPDDGNTVMATLDGDELALGPRRPIGLDRHARTVPRTLGSAVPPPPIRYPVR